jgi:hypothetical protein
MKNYTRLMLFLCGVGGLAINIRRLVRSMNNNESIVSDVVGVCIWILYILVLQYSFKTKKRKKDA